MLTRSETADLPDLGDQTKQQERIAALGITISQFQKTIQGRALIERQELFILAGRLYQGYNQKAVEVPEDQCSDAELQATHDIDGTLHRIIESRRRRLEGNKNAKDRESAERRQKQIASERDELELRVLRRQVEQQDAADAAKAPEPERFGCAFPGCGKTFDTKQQLHMHKVGATHQ